MRYAENLHAGSLAISVANPYPGTPLYDICKKEAYLVQDFQLDKLTTRIGKIPTSEFNPTDVEKPLITTLLRHGLKHPLGMLHRLAEQFRTGPKETFFLS